MPTSATGNRRERGFTLVETMVELAVIGLMAAVVVVNLPTPGENLSREGERFAARLLAARDHAIVANRETAAMIDARGYRFAERDGNDWRALGNPPLVPTPWHEGTNISLGPDNRTRVSFDSVGMSDPRKLVLSQGERSLVVTVEASGEVSVDAAR
jgi:general secretion pathway protein H